MKPRKYWPVQLTPPPYSQPASTVSVVANRVIGAPFGSSYQRYWI
jgi:hypothetical protein